MAAAVARSDRPSDAFSGAADFWELWTPSGPGAQEAFEISGPVLDQLDLVAAVLELGGSAFFQALLGGADKSQVGVGALTQLKS